MAKALTAKQEAFCLAYLETGNASEAYRRAYNVSPATKPNTVEKRACELLKNGKVTGRIAELQSKAAEKAVLDRAWVLERLMRNARIALGEEPILLKVKNTNRKTKRVTVVEIEVSDRDGGAANQALGLLGKTEEVRLFVDRVEATGRNGAPLVPEATAYSDRDLARAIVGVFRDAHNQQNEAEPDEPEVGVIPTVVKEPPRRWKFNPHTGALE
jgi:phage terminase small subunit